MSHLVESPCVVRIVSYSSFVHRVPYPTAISKLSFRALVSGPRDCYDSSPLIPWPVLAPSSYPFVISGMPTEKELWTRHL
jgi:hypothetical protein